MGASSGTMHGCTRIKIPSSERVAPPRSLMPKPSSRAKFMSIDEIWNGEKYKKLRDSGKSLVGTGADSRTSKIKKIKK